MAHAGNTNMGENNSRVCEEVQHNRVFVAKGRRGEEGGEEGGQKTQVYAFSGHERIEERSDDSKALKILRLIPRGDARLPGGKTC